MTRAWSELSAFRTHSTAGARHCGRPELRPSEEREPTESDPAHLFAMLNHELRTPLGALLGFAELLDADMSRAELVELVKRIKSNARALGEIVDTLQDLPELERGQLELKDGLLDIRELADDLVASFCRQAQIKGLVLKAEIDSRAPSLVRGASGSLRQVLSNLLCNALKFTERGEVRLRVQQLGASGDQVRLRYSVVDTGRGIPSDMQQRVFERFVRIEEDSAACTPGSGLGLSICSTLLAAMGSRMKLESEPDRGSSFSFELTHEVLGRELAPTAAQASELGSQAGKATPVLIVDDDHDNLELFGRLVRREGFVADLARNAHEALSMTDCNEYGMLITDVHMPGVDGFELARLFRDRATLAAKPPMTLVAVTADSLLQGESGRALGERFDAVLIKPVKPRLLARILTRYLPANGGQSNRGAEFCPKLVDASLIDLVPEYLARRRDDLAVLRAFLSGNVPVQRVATIGHRMRGTGLSYGFPRIGALGAALEDAARAEQRHRIVGIVEALEPLLEEITEAAHGRPK